MFAISYFEVDITCIIILCVILRRNLHNFAHSKSGKLFTAIVSIMIAFAVCDLIGGIAQDEKYRINYVVASIVNSGYFCMAFIASFLSFLYVQYDLGLSWVNDSKRKILSITPGILLSIMTIATLKFKFFFYITADGQYVRAPYYIIFITLGYVYFIIMGIQCIVMLADKKHFAKRSQLRADLSYIFWVLLGGTLQTLFPGPSIIMIGITVALLQLFLNNQNIKITVDPLTQISNREKLTQYLETKMQTRYRDDGEIVYLIMMDLDRFKEINDNFGHLEGDSVLITFAEILKNTYGGRSALISRYGGDEFCVVLNAQSVKEVYDTIKEINSQLHKINNENKKGYEIRTSIGWAILSDDVKSIPEFFKKADMELYIAKGRR